MWAQARRSGATFLGLPNVYRGRIHGESKLNWSIAFEAVRLLLRGVFEPVSLLPGGVKARL